MFSAGGFGANEELRFGIGAAVECYRGSDLGWARGEVSNLRAQASGHVYFTLKDAGAQLSAVLFRGDAMKQTVKLREVANGLMYILSTGCQWRAIPTD